MFWQFNSKSDEYKSVLKFFEKGKRYRNWEWKLFIHMQMLATRHIMWV